jgi:hypothetical protein
MAALLTLLAIGGSWFWIFVILASMSIIASLENNRRVIATFLAIGSILALVFLGNTGIFSWVAAHPLLLILYGVGYIVVGALYGILKWYLLLHDRADRYLEVRTSWLEGAIKQNSSKLPAKVCQEALTTGILAGDVKKAWKKYAKDQYYGRRLTKPSVGRNKGRILSWVTYWPLSGLWTLINDPIRRIFKWLYRRISTKLQIMADKVFADIDIEMEDD